VDTDANVKVKPLTPVKYKGEHYKIGQELMIDIVDYEYHKDLYELVGYNTSVFNQEGMDDLSVFRKPYLLEIAKMLHVFGYSNMTKKELTTAIENKLDQPEVARQSKGGNEGSQAQGQNPTSEELESLTDEELMQLAREKEIEDYEEMNREELLILLSEEE